MKILLVSYFFPPYNTVGAIRTGKTAKYLVKNGHEVRVLTACEPYLQEKLPETLPVELTENNIHRTAWADVNWFPRSLLRILKIRRPDAPPRGTSSNTPGQALLQLYRSFFNLPDSAMGWIPFAILEGRKLVKSFKPDILYASSSPPSSLFVARILSDLTGVPWVAEFRDLWVEGYDYRFRGLRKKVDTRLEKLLLENARGLVTVSETWQKKLQAKFPLKPVGMIPNGFDPDDTFPDRVDHSTQLRVLFTGSIYLDKHDLHPLFHALQLLTEEQKELIRFEFYTQEKNVSAVQNLAERWDVGEMVEVIPYVPYREALRKQRNADVLLHLLWNDPDESGLITAKLYEYLAAKRPILAIGLGAKAARDLIVERKAGTVATQATEIKGALEAWITQKQEGGVPDLPEEVNLGFDRELSTRKLSDWMLGLRGQYK